MQASQYFSLIVPVCAALLGAALVACWGTLRKHKYLLWLAAAYVLPAIAIAAQTMMSNQELAQTCVLLGALYLLGSWALAQGMALRYGGSAHPRLALLISLVALAGLYYFSQVTDQLHMRMLILNVAMNLLLLLGVAAVYRSRRSNDWLERVLRGSYLCFVGYSLARLAVVAVLMRPDPSQSLVQSPLWLLMLAVNLLLSLWFVGVLLAVTVREVLHRLQKERDLDPLTQVLNRRALFERAPARLERLRTGCWALLMCDVDYFKQINDSLGHAVGDEVLVTVANVLTRNVRHTDLVVRLGGEEFLILLHCESLQSACAVANRMREQLMQETHPRMGVRLTASFGVAEVAGAEQLHAAMDQADSLLYEAKRAGRNRVVAAMACA